MAIYTKEEKMIEEILKVLALTVIPIDKDWVEVPVDIIKMAKEIKNS